MNALPTIAKAARLIALDNGCVNRRDGDPTADVMALLAVEMPERFLARMEAELTLLSNEDLETACAGEDSERAALPLSAEAHEFLNRIFEAMGEVRP